MKTFGKIEWFERISMKNSGNSQNHNSKNQAENQLKDSNLSRCFQSRFFVCCLEVC